MLKLIAEDFIKVEHIETVLPLYQELVTKTKEESACLAYELYHDLKDPGHFVFIEEWPDEAALTLHTKTDHFTRLVPLINQYTRAKGQFTRMSPLNEAFNLTSD
ncbi:antibiotic biosynthesis monooxygenase [Vagococcus sp. BWB3-3]|uniref:Antibiotic biosynthesis monooxygenase n=1 Tax=Vagococcus allomyrinae TaxID=2794353 RepID=A0A940SU53_9ENTE|nr:putative quinol monooxygenase [Vagococcus allomyrinae]MBP1043917.1 antibiotic biosynthesis monooxygenase [Vagococcus allomyrinae]